MPDPGTGKMTITEYKEEIRARGFDGYTSAELEGMLYRAFLYIARKFPWYWRETTITVAYPTDGSYDLQVHENTNGIGIRAVEAVYLTKYPSASSRIRLEALTKGEFWDVYFRDLSAGVKGTPEAYFVNENQLHALPLLSPVGAAQLDIHFLRKPASGGISIETTHLDCPVEWEEAIIDATLVRCHRRANEISLAQVKQAEVNEFLDDMQDETNSRLDDQQDRVLPDNSWA
jgi:hypothetical protein